MSTTPDPAAPTTQEEPQAGPARLVVSLTLLSLISGLLLAVAYELTLPPIKAWQQRSVQEAVHRVVPGTSRLQPLQLRDGALQAVGMEEAMAGEAVYAAYDDQGVFKGYAIPAAGGGFQDIISVIYGYDPDQRRIIGMNVLESRETPGLGDKIFKDPVFVAQWSDRVVEPALVATKKGEGTDANHVDCITGATISSKAVVRIINDSNTAWRPALPGAAQAPPPPAEGQGS